MARKNRERERDEQLAESRERAKAWPGPISLEGLTELAASADTRERRLALALMQREIYERDVPAFHFFPLARRLVGDPDNICRWQALFVVSECDDTHLAAVLEVCAEHADSADADMRAGIACVVLEHVLDRHFDEALPWLREQARGASANFEETIRLCSYAGHDGERGRRVEQVLRNAARGRRARD